MRCSTSLVLLAFIITTVCALPHDSTKSHHSITSINPNLKRQSTGTGLPIPREAGINKQVLNLRANDEDNIPTLEEVKPPLNFLYKSRQLDFSFAWQKAMEWRTYEDNYVPEKPLTNQQSKNAKLMWALLEHMEKKGTILSYENVLQELGVEKKL
ncbi:hypothetical protein BC835DRAFT_1398829 [Cytidiella melzeri]|nr:hypothetical protein BC835DRAFT_1398829 [Cytidiella melzeri]